MTMDRFENGVETVLQISQYFQELKTQAVALVENQGPTSRGYFTPQEDDQTRALLASYWQTRNALFELIVDHKSRYTQLDAPPAEAFLIPFAAALTLVDAARFLRNVVEPKPLVRRKLNEPAATFGIPGGTYDTIQRSLLSARNAWQLFLAQRYFEAHELTMREAAEGKSWQPILSLIDRLRGNVQVASWEFARAKLRTRSDQLLRQVGRNTIMSALYGLQKFVSSMMSDVYVRPGHSPGLPRAIADQLEAKLRPGDVLLVRKQYALTNYFLPGYWPHVALYLGRPDEQAAWHSGLPDVGEGRHAGLVTKGGSAAAPPGGSQETPGTASGTPIRVLEALKDGVRLRGLGSPFGSDSLVILRPRLSAEQIVAGIRRGLTHVGKPYDFDFDFSRSDRLVCTEVVYRSYDGIGPVRFHLKYRAGRPTLSGFDLVEHSLHPETCWEPVAGYAAEFDDSLVEGERVKSMMHALACS